MWVVQVQATLQQPRLSFEELGEALLEANMRGNVGRFVPCSPGHRAPAAPGKLRTALDEPRFADSQLTVNAEGGALISGGI